MFPRPRRTARQPVLGLCLPVETLGSPEMAPVEPPVLLAPSKLPPTGAQRRRIIGADDDDPAPALL